MMIKKYGKHNWKLDTEFPLLDRTPEKYNILI